MGPRAEPARVSKSRLSEYLRRVRAGEVLLACDRDQVVARIEPAGGMGAGAGDDARWLSELERRGTIRRASASLPRSWLARRPTVGGRRCGRPARRAYRRAMRFWDGSALVPGRRPRDLVGDGRVARGRSGAGRVDAHAGRDLIGHKRLFRDGVAREADGRAHELDERFMLSPACSASFLARVPGLVIVTRSTGKFVW